MTRIVFLTALTALVGCKKDECDDTAAGACDTGAEEVDADGAADADGGDEPVNDSCTISDVICVLAAEPDNEAWCDGLPPDYRAVYSADACSADGATATCTDMTAGGDFTADGAMAWYYSVDGSLACADSGGTYTGL